MVRFTAQDLRVAAKKIVNDGSDGFDSAARNVGYDVAGQLYVLFMRNEKELTEIAGGSWPNPEGVKRLCLLFTGTYCSGKEKAVALLAAQQAATS